MNTEQNLLRQQQLRNKKRKGGSVEKIPLAEPCLGGNEWKYIKECLDTNWVSSTGEFVDRFESNIAYYTGTKYAVATVNGTAAIHTALNILGVGPGDKVLVPTLTFIASVNPILYCGAEPVFIDSEEETYNIDPDQVIKKIYEMISNDEKPKVVIVVHLYGQPAEMDPIVDICKKNSIYLIEDATESLGSKYNGKMTGSLGDIACFSFNGNKLITAGGGGMLVTSNKDWAEKARYLTTQAKDDPVQFIHNEIGYNYRLTNIQAAMGVAQLEQIDEFIYRKRQIARYYYEKLSKTPGIIVTKEKKDIYCNYWLTTILVDEFEYGINSKELYKILQEKGIMVRPFFKPIHQLPMYKNYNTECNVAKKLWEKGICLPCSISISEKELEYVVDSIKKLFNL